MTPYEILQISTHATEAEIKGAYRRLAKALHPDSGDPGDVERFRQVQEAYETLSSPERRRAYDAAQRVPVSFVGGFTETVAPFRRGFEEIRAPGPEPSAHIDIVLSEAEAGRGGSVVLEVPVEAPCRRCDGRRFDFFGGCPSCAGTGRERGFERVAFAIPRGVEDGELVLARRRDGASVRARIRVR
jgi:DnaJ-class molecular chaperone